MVGAINDEGVQRVAREGETLTIPSSRGVDGTGEVCAKHGGGGGRRVARCRC